MTFFTCLLDISQKFYANIEAVFMFRSTCLLTYLYVYLSSILTNNDMEMHFKKYARKRRLEDVSVTLVCRRQSGIFLGEPWALRIIVLLVFWWMKIEDKDVAIEKVVLKIKLTIVEYRRDRNIGIYIWTTFSHMAET